MERFDQNGKLIIPDHAVIAHELKKLGVETAGVVRVKQVFCPNGHQLILRDNTSFDNVPGIKLLLNGAQGAEEIYISSVLNKRQRSGGGIFRVGDRLEVRCPVCNVPLPVLAPCDCQWDGEYVMLSLDEDPTNRNAVCFCNIWGCPNGDIRLAGEVIAEYQRNYEL